MIKGMPIPQGESSRMSPSFRLIALFLVAIFLFSSCGPQVNAPAQVFENGLLTIEEYPLKSLECESDPEARCFVPVSGTFEEIIAHRQTERERLADLMPWMNSNTVAATLNGKPLVASLSFVAEGDHSNVTVQVVHGEEVIYTRSLGQAGPLNQLQGLWVSDGHWYLEVAEYLPGSEYPYVKGLIVQDGESLNESMGYQDAFGFTLLRGKPFFFFMKSGLINAYLHGETVSMGYEDVAHYGCCSAARLNPIKAENMISFFARRDGNWNYVEAGIYPFVPNQSGKNTFSAPGRSQ